MSNEPDYPYAAVVERDDGLLELIWSADAETVPITRPALQAFVDTINNIRRLATPPPPAPAAAVDPDQLTIYDQLDEQPCQTCHGEGVIERDATPDEVDAGCELGVAYDNCPDCEGNA